MVTKKLRRGLHIVKKGRKYQVVQQPTAGKPTVQRTFSTKTAAQSHVREVKALAKKYRSLF